jgi:preprotein translocase subunit SecB
MSEQPAAPQFAIQTIYTKDISFESPNVPHVFRDQWKPEFSFNIDSGARNLDDENYEVNITVTVTVNNGDKTAFLVEVKQSGIFTIVNFGDEQRDHMLGAYCPNVLFPYAREVISSLVSRGGFPQLVMAPFNFETAYAQRRAQQQQQQAESGGETG